MTTITTESILLQRATALKFYGLLSHWDEIKDESWLEPLINWEESERSERSLERRLNSAHLGKFKSLSEFDWGWPTQCDRRAIEEWMRLGFIKDKTNPILCGPNGVGKSTIARNIGYQAVMKGYTVLFTTAGTMLNDLAAQDGDNALRRKLKYYANPQFLLIDEVGYLSYSNRHADLLFEIIARRYEEKSTLITTNKPFSEWGELFPNAACVVSLIDRLVHHSEIVSIEADSYRLKDAKEDNEKRQAVRAKNNKKTKTEKKEEIK
ncbi:ATP-binding protein [Patescibacteria group bacterium]|nr:ATP-binding protein [Patescibacteria group bacterium]